MVPHSWHRGIQQSADMLCNRSTWLKLEKKILITIIFTIIYTTHHQRQCVCRQRCLQPCMDHLRWFRRTSYFLWIYRHRPVAQFLQWRLGRQSKYGRHGGDFGGSTIVKLALSMCAFSPPDEFGKSTCAVLLPAMVLLMGGRGGRFLASGEKENVSQLMVLIGTLGLWRYSDVCFLMACMSVKKYGHHMILRWCHTNSGVLYMMVPSDWYGNVV